MIIDFHTHIFPDKIAEKTISSLAKMSNTVPHTNGTVDGLCKNIEKAKIDVAIALPVLTRPEQFDSVLKFASEINQRFSSGEIKVLSFAGIHPKCEDIPAKIKQIANLGFKGVKIHPQYQDTYIDDLGYVEILEQAKLNDLIVVTHAGVDEGYKNAPVLCPPDRTVKLIKKVNYSKFVLAHFGGNLQWNEVLETIAGKDVYLDTSYMLKNISKDLFRKILFKHGEDKVLFGTDCPWRDIAEEVEMLKHLVSEINLQEKIFAINAKKLLNI